MHDGPPRILLDTNVLVANFRPSNAFGLLLEGARSEQIELVVPELVLQEAAVKYRENVGARVAELEKSIARLKRVDVEVSISNVPDPGALAVRYEAELRRSLKAAGAIVASLPAVGHDQLLSRALARRKPFKAGGAGYRDALIWETVLEQVRVSRSLVFCTMDVSDFGDRAAGPDEERLAEELGDELEQCGLVRDAVTLTTDLKRFVGDHVDVQVVAVSEVERSLPRFAGELREVIEEELIGYDFAVPDLADIEVEVPLRGTTRGATDAQVIASYELSALVVEDARLLSEDELALELYAEVDADLDIEIEVFETSHSFELFTQTRTLGVSLEARYERSTESIGDVRLFSARVL
jgi:predicted nucleic acid-binding protein